LYYRKDLLDAAGYSAPPTTWDELTQMAQKIMKDKGIKNGFVFQGANYEGGTDNGLEYIRTSGGDVLNGTTVIVNQPAAIRGLTIQRSLVTSGVAPAAVAEYKEDESAGAFAGGDSVFIRSWGYFDSVIADKTQSKLTVDQVGIAPIPRADASIKPVNVGGGWNMYMNANSHKQDAAWELMTFISAAAQQKIWAIQGDLLPTVTSLYDDADLGKQVPVIAAGKTITSETTTPPISPYYSDMSLAMASHFNASLRGAETPEQAASALQKELEAIVSRA
jgi:multiple sugar transport system substrate-binding protein